MVVSTVENVSEGCQGLVALLNMGGGLVKGDI